MRKFTNAELIAYVTGGLADETCRLIEAQASCDDELAAQLAVLLALAGPPEPAPAPCESSTGHGWTAAPSRAPEGAPGGGIDSTRHRLRRTAPDRPLLLLDEPQPGRPDACAGYVFPGDAGPGEDGPPPRALDSAPTTPALPEDLHRPWPVRRGQARFTYPDQSEPLPGYRITQALGRGGMGEVYKAETAAGKVVAIKMIRDHLDVELRGMTQCLNFKHPNLVQLFDICRDGSGNHWVIMEHVAGPPLNQVLAQHPGGLDPELACRWFLGLAAGIAYLHGHGVVHRDLKPANIFIEGDTVKIGDYGLSKYIGCSQQATQTQSIGTVHYMAPEISCGRYNAQVDVYAAGVILFEMLTGRVPFRGESPGEILMKHLNARPDLSGIPPELARVLARGLAKKPSARYRTITDMAADLTAAADADTAVNPWDFDEPSAERPTAPDPLPGRRERTRRRVSACVEQAAAIAFTSLTFLIVVLFWIWLGE